MQVSCVTNPTDFYALAPEWDDLVERSERDLFFLRWLWVGAWWRHFGAERDLWLLVARVDGALVGVAPLCRHFRLFKSTLSYRQLHFMGSGIAAADHLDFILAKGHEADITHAFLDYIETHRAEWDMLYLEGLAKDSWAWQGLQKRGWQMKVEAMVCPYVTLPSSWDAYEATLSKNLRKNLKRYNRALQKLNGGDSPFAMVDDAETFQKLMALHQAVRQRHGDLGAFYEKKMVAFQMEVVEKCRQNNTLRLYTLTIQNEIQAVIYAIAHHHTINYYATGYDQPYSKYGVGRQLFGYMVAHAIAEGATEIDLLRGDEAYKFKWTPHTRQNINVWASINWRGRLILTTRKIGNNFVEVIKQYVAF